MVLSTRASASNPAVFSRDLAESGGTSSYPVWVLLPIFFAAVVASHWTLLRLPYFWDEGGYYIPAAWDFFRTGSLIPITTMRNAHPPLPSILLAGWWKLFGFNILATRLCVCLVAAVALLGVFRLARAHVGRAAAFTTAALTAIYPIWFVQSTLAHADIFAAAFTLWALALYLEPAHASAPNQALRRLAVAALFACAVLAKETAIVTPIALAALEAVLLVRHPAHRRPRLAWLLALAAPALPLAAWYAYHREKTGFAFGNPEFFRYNATANLDAHRILLSLYHRGIHLTAHMNMFVAVVCAVAAILMPAFADRPRLSRPFLAAVAVVLSANTIAFSVLGGALLTRYLLPMYPLVVLLCVAAWQRHLRQWAWLAAFTAAAFLAALWINPPYAFAAEDNLTYRDMIVLHEQAIDLLQSKFPEATVLTAWPGAAELERPELGYTAKTFKVAEIENFSLPEVEKAAADPGAYDTALLFSTKWAPPRNALSLSRGHEAADAKYFDFHIDLYPAEAAALLHGEIVWQAHRGNEWAAVLRFPRIVNASLAPGAKTSLRKPAEGDAGASCAPKE